MARGRLITIEGLDGAGKTTLAAGLAQHLEAQGKRTRALREPGGVALSEGIRDLVKNPELDISPRAETLLYAAARAQLIEERVKPLLGDGWWVVLDRFVGSSLAYQGAGRELGEEAVRAVNEFGTGGLTPDLTLLLQIDPETGRERQALRAAQRDRLELEDDDFFQRVHSFYLDFAKRPGVIVIDASRSPEEVFTEALLAVDSL